MSDADGGHVPASVLSMIVDGLREVKESVARLSVDMTGQLSKMPDIYVPRREVEHRLDEHTIDIGELRNRAEVRKVSHDADIKHLRDCIEMVEEKRRVEKQAADAQRVIDKRWLIGTALTVIALVLTLLTLVLNQLN